jgi:hypothetical protein
VEVEDSTIRDRIERLVREVVDFLNEESDGDYYYKLGTITVEQKDNGTITVELSLEYIVHFYEISEEVSEAISELSEEEIGRMSEGEIERMYDSLYAEKLNEINDSYAIPLELHATLDYIGGGRLIVMTEPVYCEFDYCNAGLWISLKLEDIPVESFDDIKYTIKTVIQKVSEFHQI